MRRKAPLLESSSTFKTAIYSRPFDFLSLNQLVVNIVQRTILLKHTNTHLTLFSRDLLLLVITSWPHHRRQVEDLASPFVSTMKQTPHLLIHINDTTDPPALLPTIQTRRSDQSVPLHTPSMEYPTLRQAAVTSAHHNQPRRLLKILAM